MDILDWLPSNWYMNQHKTIYILQKILSFGMSFLSDLADEFLTGKRDNGFWPVREIIYVEK